MVIVIVSMCRDSGGNSGHGVVVVKITINNKRTGRALRAGLVGDSESESAQETPCSYLPLNNNLVHRSPGKLNGMCLAGKFSWKITSLTFPDLRSTALTV